MQTYGTAEPLPKSKWTLFNAPTVFGVHGVAPEARPRGGVTLGVLLDVHELGCHAVVVVVETLTGCQRLM